MSRFRLLARLGAVLLGLGGGALPAQTVPGRIVNTATLSYGPDAARRVVASNTVALDVQGKRPTAFSFHLPPPGYTLSGLGCRTSPTPQLIPAPIDAATLAAAPPLDALDMNTPLIVAIDNPGGNHDPLVRESTRINVEVGPFTSIVMLIETAPDSGVFAGGIPSARDRPEAIAACDLPEERGALFGLSFTEDEFSLGSSGSLLIDPAGFVFDSQTAELIDGAIVSLVDASGAPAAVYGDDGRSAYPSTVTSGAAVTDASGRVYPGLPGRYRFPLTAPGRYFIRITPPVGYVAPSAVPRATLAALRDPAGQPFILNDASFGGGLTLRNDPFYADIPIDRPGDAVLVLTKTASVRQAAPGDFVQYRIQATNRGTDPARALHLSDTLPAGLRYEHGSTRGGDEPGVSGDGRTLDFAVPALAGGQSLELRYVVTIAPGAPVGEALNRAVLRGAGITSNEAAAAVRIRPLLFTDAMTIIGRVTEGRCGDPADHRKGVAGVRLLMEDGVFVVTDRDGLYHFEGVRSGTHIVQIDRASIPPTHAPVACDSDTRQAGSAISRFVDGGGGLLKRVDFQLMPTGVAAAAAAALPIAVDDDATAAGNRDWLATHPAPGIDWLFPNAGHNPRSPTQRVVVKHGAGQRVALSINGRQVDPISFDGTDGDATTGVALSKWTGVPLTDGDNRLEARVLAADGQVVTTLERVVHYAGPGIRAVADIAHSRLVADGLTRPLLAVRVTDKAGRPVRAGTRVPFTVDQPYAAAVEADAEQRRQAAGADRTANTAQVVGDDGIAFLALQPTTQAGAVRAVVALAEDKTIRTSAIRAWLTAPPQSWVVVGFGAGSLGYATLDKHARALPRSARNAVVTDGQLAFYAKGRVKGSWLATIAYDSDRRYDPDRGLLGTIDPDRYYTVYGDGARQGYDAATRRKLYLRLERRDVYALFGDFETGFTDTQLLRYDRTLNGVKAAYEGSRVRATGFAAHTDTLYARDEIQGNGLSGPYRLRGRDIVPNSDKLRIEVRDRFRSERIVSSTALTRHIDYDIDTRLGTVRFREPVLGRDGALNPIFIVADYEVEGGRSAQLAAAARVATRLGGHVELGASVIRDETVGDATVAGIDVKVRANATTELRGELGSGGRGGVGKGLAYIAEFDHHGAALDLLAYARQQDARFGVGQQNSVEAGTRKIGIDGRLRLTDRLSLTGTAWHQTQLDGRATRIAGDVRFEYRRDTGTVFIGGQVAADRGVDGAARDSRLLTIGGSQSLFGDRLVLSGQTQFAPGGASASVDFPVRHQITASYRIRPGLRLIGGYEIADGDGYVAHTGRIGVDVAPWTGAKLMTTVNQQAIGENGQRTYAQYGLSQSVPLGSHWTVDATLDSSRTLNGAIPAGAVVTAFQPVAAGGFVGQDQQTGDYTAATIGGNYRGGRWSWNGRLEYRAADAGDRWGITANVLRTLGEGRTLASSVKAYTITDTAGAVAAYAQADIAIAWRPLDSRWSLLERLELRHERADAGFTDGNALGVPAYGAGDQVTTRAISNLAVNYRTGAEGAGHGLEATVYYGAKYVAGRFADDLYDGYIDVAGFELRQDLGRRVDIGVQGSVQHAWSRGAVAWSGGPSAGLSPAANLWISAGYNIAGYRDRDFEDDRYTRAGPYVTIRLKFDQATLGGATRALFGGRR